MVLAAHFPLGGNVAVDAMAYFVVAYYQDLDDAVDQVPIVD